MRILPALLCPVILAAPLATCLGQAMPQSFSPGCRSHDRRNGYYAGGNSLVAQWGAGSSWDEACGHPNDYAIPPGSGKATGAALVICPEADTRIFR